MPLTKEKRKLHKLIEQSDSEESEHELSYYVNDRIKLMKEVLKTVKPKKIKLMAPSCLRNTDIEEINSMLLEELLGISNKRLKYIFKGQSLDEDSSSSSEDNPIDVISLDDISDDDLVINIDDDGEASQQKKLRKESKHRRCKKEKIKSETKTNDKKTADGEEGLVSNKNLMSVLELLELQARARAIKSQLLLENAKTQESLTMSKIPTLEENVGSDDEVIIKTAKTEEIIITSSESETEDLEKSESNNANKINEESTVSKNAANGEEDKKCTDNTDISDNTEISEKVEEPPKIKIIENKELPSRNDVIAEDNNKVKEKELTNEKEIEQIIGDTNKISDDKNKEKVADNDEIIQINLSDDEMEELK